MISFCIITCTYNAERELPRTLESVGRQTYANLHHIIMDGRSSDSTVATAHAYAEEFRTRGSRHRITVRSEKDNGLYDAMNKAMAMAGEDDYIVFINAGDTLADDTTLERIAGQAARLDALPGVIYGDTDIVDDKGHFLHKRRLQPPERLTWKSFRMGMLVCHQAFYARADLARSTPYDLRYRLSADVDWCIRIMRQAQRQGLSLHNTHLTLCRYLEGGMSIRNHRASLIERFRIMAHHYGLIPTMLFHLWFLMRK